MPTAAIVLLTAVPLCKAFSSSPTLAQIASTVRDACTAAIADDEWPTPEGVAWVAHQSLMKLSANNDPVLPPQGEYLFASSTDFGDRFAIAEPLAHAGDSLAQQTLGLLIFSGVGGAPQDLRASAEWHAAAAAQGNIDALATLGGCVRRGVGAEQDEATGRTLIEAAAAAGSPVGLSKLGVLYDEGASGLSPDSWRAAQCFEAAAARGSALGLFNHGWALLYGIGSARDVQRGLAAWKAAAALAPEDGSEEAAFHLYEERALLPDRAEAVIYLKLSHDLGFDKAVKAWRRRESKRKLGPEFFGKRRGKRFIRNDKARSFTTRELRGEELLD